MRLELIEGGFGTKVHTAIKDEILALTESGRRSFLIVPEQQTLSAEAEMAKALPSSAPLYFVFAGSDLAGNCRQQCIKWWL